MLNLRKLRHQRKLTISELSHLSKIESRVLRDCEFNNTLLNEIDTLKLELVFKHRNPFFNMSKYEADCYAKFIKNNYETTKV
jgi:hypothetical protein